MSGLRSKRKGAAGEREAAAALELTLDLPAGSVYRSCQYAGKEGAGDVLGVPGIHVEVKRCESLRLYPAVRQAQDDAGPDDVPVVVHRRNLEEWLVIVPLADLPNLGRAITAILAKKTPDSSPE